MSLCACHGLGREGMSLPLLLGGSELGINCGVTALMCKQAVSAAGGCRGDLCGDHVPVRPHHMPKHQSHKGARGALAQMCFRKKNKDLGWAE